jgi:hypothetical protein
LAAGRGKLDRAKEVGQAIQDEQQDAVSTQPETQD